MFELSEFEEIEQALASVIIGRTVSLEDVVAWIDSWDTDHEIEQPKSGKS